MVGAEFSRKKKVRAAWSWCQVLDKKNKKDSRKGVNCFYGVNTTDKFDTLMPLPIEVRMDLNHHYANLQEKHNQVFQWTTLSLSLLLYINHGPVFNHG